MPATSPAARNSRVNQVATWLLEYLGQRESDVLPHLRAFEHLYPGMVSLYTIDQAFRLLVRQSAITRRTGTRHIGRGHAAVRIIATGRVFRTDGCPFDPPA